MATGALEHISPRWARRHMLLQYHHILVALGFRQHLGNHDKSAVIDGGKMLSEFAFDQPRFYLIDVLDTQFCDHAETLPAPVGTGRSFAS